MTLPFKISLQGRHLCDDTCSIICKGDDYYCSHEDYIEELKISISNHDDIINKISNLDEILIHDKEITIIFNFLKNSLVFKCQSNRGFTRKKMVKYLINIYKNIYYQNTNPPNIHSFSIKCYHCKKEILEYETAEIEENKTEIKCGMCNCGFNYNRFLTVLPCGHYFHKQCSDNWLKKNKICYLCKYRPTLMKCKHCKKGPVNIKLCGISTPIIDMYPLINRWNDMFINEIIYDPNNKNLNVNIK